MLTLFLFGNRRKHISMWTFPPASFTTVRTLKLRTHDISTIGFLIKVNNSGSDLLFRCIDNSMIDIIY